MRVDKRLNEKNKSARYSPCKPLFHPVVSKVVIMEMCQKLKLLLPREALKEIEKNNRTRTSD